MRFYSTIRLTLPVRAVLPLVASLLLAFAIPSQALDQANHTEWELRGDLTEGCSCSPPCSCNFAVGSSPHSFCWFIFSLKIKDGHYESVDLMGMHLAAGVAGKGLVWYIDQRANQEQADALRSIAQQITSSVYRADGIKPKELPMLGFKRATIEQYANEKGCSLKIGDAGGFESSYIMGMDGKTPVVVENNWSWNMKHGMKAKTQTLKYHDGYGNLINLKGTNASQGEFEWADTTQIYFR